MTQQSQNIHHKLNAKKSPKFIQKSEQYKPVNTNPDKSKQTKQKDLSNKNNNLKIS
jgi:hypothetical protein